MRVASVAALAAATALIATPSFAERPSTPAELTATARLNQDIADMNAAASELEQILDQQYQEQKSQNDALQQQYREQVVQYREKKTQNDLLRQQYQEQLEAYRQSSRGEEVGNREEECQP